MVPLPAVGLGLLNVQVSEGRVSTSCIAQPVGHADCLRSEIPLPLPQVGKALELRPDALLLLLGQRG